MAYKSGIDREQMMMCSWDSLLGEDNDVRIIDAFVNSLDIEQLGFEKATPAAEGRPAYDPRALLKLYIYGNINDIRSSRKLAKACRTNIEVIWLTGGIKPDFRTVSDFRKDNIVCMKKVFHEFNHKISTTIEWGFQSIDGSKFQASNSKDRNFTLSKLDDRIKRMDLQTEEYLRLLDEVDSNEEETTGAFTKEQIEEKLEKISERKARYEGYLKKMEEENLAQISLTDPDSKLMKNKNGYAVSYNIQTAVDSETHLIRNYETTTEATDHGQLLHSVEGIRTDGEILETVADKGYHEKDDMMDCLKNGVIPNVILPEGQDTYELETDYKPCDNVENLTELTDAESLAKCLDAGVVPAAYKDIIEDIKIVQKKKRVLIPSSMEQAASDEEQMIAKAAEGFFVRDMDRDLVYCPAGEILRKKSTTKNGSVRYCNKLACKHCKYKDKCMKNRKSDNYPFKVVEFGDKITEKPCRTWNQEMANQERMKHKYRYEMHTVVQMKFRPDRQKMDQRKGLSEHPFGTIKRTMNAGYFLLRSKKKVDGEFALFSLGYNIKRAINLIGFEQMMAVMG